MPTTQDMDKQHEKRWNLSQAKLSENQLHIDDYFSRLSVGEVEWIERFRKTISHMNYEYFRRTTTLFAIFAVGSTTFPESYWIGLEKYLQENDPEKLGYAKRRGEDIDLKFVPEFLGQKLIRPDLELEYRQIFKRDEPFTYAEIFHIRKRLKVKRMAEWTEAETFLWKNFDFFQIIVAACIDEGLEYKIYEHGSPCGSRYITVPKQFRENESVMRYKSIDYSHPTVHVKIPGYRDIHISVEDSCNAAQKLEIERTEDNPFAVVYRSPCHTQLNQAIERRKSIG